MYKTTFITHLYTMPFISSQCVYTILNESLNNPLFYRKKSVIRFLLKNDATITGEEFELENAHRIFQ